MRLTLQTDYALRLLMQVAIKSPALTTIAEVAERNSVSKNHLMKVAHLLGRAGFIETVRGRGGGLRLAKPPEKIRVGEVARLLEQSSAIADCFPNGRGGCVLTPACRLKGVLASALEAFFEVLDSFTIADLIVNNHALAKLLDQEGLA